MVQIALLQLNSGPDIDENLQAVETMVREAAAKGATFILTPENTCHMVSPMTEKLKSAPVQEEHIVLDRLKALAKELKVWILLGSVSVKVDDEHIANRSYLISDQGEWVAKYDKIHLFDADLPTGEKHRESDIVRPGEKAVAVQTTFGKIGMTICYDLRFSNLYRELTKAGANIMVVPSAFTVPTGQAHWEVLLRARAIETGSFVLAPAQCGTHHGGRETYGHSMAVNPWGEVIAEAGTEPGITMVDIDLAEVKKAQNAIPSLLHDKPFDFKPEFRH